MFDFCCENKMSFSRRVPQHAPGVGCLATTRFALPLQQPSSAGCIHRFQCLSNNRGRNDSTSHTNLYHKYNKIRSNLHCPVAYTSTIYDTTDCAVGKSVFCTTLMDDFPLLQSWTHSGTSVVLLVILCYVMNVDRCNNVANAMTTCQ